MDIDRERLIERLRQYFDPDLSDADLRSIMPTAVADASRFDAKATRQYLVARGLKPEKFVAYSYRPFDNRWLYWEPETKLLDEKRSEYFPHVFEGNIWLEARQKQPMERFDRGYVVKTLADNFGNGLSNFFPLYLQPESSRGALFKASVQSYPTPNVSKPLAADFQFLKAEALDFFLHCAAVLHAPAYRTENAGALRIDWPRIPLPAAKEQLIGSADLGRQIAHLLDSEVQVNHVTTGVIRSELAAIAVVSRSGGGSLNPDAGDLDVTAGWGHRGNGGPTMPGKGKVIERDYNAQERAAIASGAHALGLAETDAFSLLGTRTLDIYLNNLAYWKNVPSRVWAYTIGGYQVIKKWLSYRERENLGRGLTTEEVHFVTSMARRIAAILLLQPQLDANYSAITQTLYPWPNSDTSDEPSPPGPPPAPR